MDPRLAEYERIVLDELRGMLNPDKWVRAGTPDWEGWVRLREVDHFFEVVEIEEIRLDIARPEHELVVLLRDPARPECLFGWRARAVDPCDFESDWLEDDRNLKDAAEMHTFVLYANLGEDVLAVGYGLPRDCSPDGINWF